MAYIAYLGLQIFEEAIQTLDREAAFEAPFQARLCATAESRHPKRCERFERKELWQKGIRSPIPSNIVGLEPKGKGFQWIDRNRINIAEVCPVFRLEPEGEGSQWKGSRVSESEANV